jgi:hypothetical protein
MNIQNSKLTLIGNASSNVRSNRASLGVFLAAYGAFFLSLVLLSYWTLSDWGKNLTYPPTLIHALLPRSFIAPIFFVTSFPALIVGASMMCVYSLRGISAGAPVDKLYVAVLLVAFGFTYQVIGAWPLGHPADFPWQWQKQIMNNGAVFTWILYLLSIVVLLVGVISLYKHSKIYHQTHRTEEQKLGETVA